MKKFLLVAAFAAVLGGVALADSCKCGVRCPLGGKCDPCDCVTLAKLDDPLNPNGAETVEPPKVKGHYVQSCGPTGCHLTFVPDAPQASDPQAVYSPQAGGACYRGRVRFVHRGPLRRFFSRR